MTVLEFFRKEDPRFNDVPDDKLINWIVKDEPEFLKDQGFRRQAKALFQRQTLASEEPEQVRQALEEEGNPFLSTAFGRAVTRGAGQSLKSIGGAADAVLSAQRSVGLPGDTSLAVGGLLAKAFGAGEKEIPTEGPSGLSDVKGARDVAALAIERGIGEQVPNLVATAVTSGLGMFAGLAPKAASVLGAITTTFPQEMGGAFNEIKELTGKEAPLTAAGVGAVNAFLETFGDSKLIEQALGGDQLVGKSVAQVLKNLAVRAGKQGAREAGTEAAQELITALSPMTQGADAPGNLGERIGTAALLGGVGGGVFSAGMDVGNRASEFISDRISSAGDRALDQALRELEQQPPSQALVLQVDRPVAGTGLSVFRQENPGVGTPPTIQTEGQVTEIPQAATPEELATTPDEWDFQPFRRANLPGGEAIPFERAGIPVERAGIPVDRPDVIPVGRATREQVAAVQILQRLDQERSQSLAEAQALEAQGRPDLAILRFSDGLASRVEALAQLRFPQAQPGATVGPVPGVVAPGTTTQENAQGIPQDPGFVTPSGVVTPGGQVESREDLQLQTPRRPQSLGTRSTQAIEAGAPTITQITPSRAAAFDDMGAITQENLELAQVVDSRGLPTQRIEDPAARLMQLMLHTEAYVRDFAGRRGVTLDAQAQALMERRFQEQALDRYNQAKAQGRPFNQAFSVETALRGALKDVSRRPNSAGTLRGVVSPLELEDQPGTIAPDVEAAGTPGMTQGDADQADRIMQWLDSADNQAEREARMNLMADQLGLTRPIAEPSEEARVLEADPAIQAEVRRFVQQQDLGRFSLGQAVGTPMTVSEVNAQVMEIMPNPELVQVVDDPTLVDQDGQPIRAQYRPDDAQPFLLNAAFLGGPSDVRSALFEELIHGVWGDPAIQALWDDVKAEVTPEELAAMSAYPEAVRLEEAAVRRVLSADGASWFDRLLAALIDAVQRVFGMDIRLMPTQRILRRALAARANGGETRNSLAQGVWKNIREVTRERQDAGDDEAIRGAAAAQGTSVPPSYLGEINALPDEGAGLVARNILRPVADAAVMGQQLAAEYAPIGPDGLSLMSGMTLAPSNAQDIAAEAVVKQSLMFQSLRQSTERRIEKASEQLTEAIGRIPEAAIAQNKADLYEGMAERLASDYRQYLVDQARTLKRGNFDAQAQQELAAAADRMTDRFRGISTAIGSGLAAISKEIPDVDLASRDTAVQWIVQRLNDPTKPRLMSDEARDWLTSKVGRFNAPIQRDPRIHKRLQAVKALASADQAAIQRIISFQRGMNKLGKRVPPAQFAYRWAKYRAGYADQMAIVREINRDVERLERNLDGAEIAKEFLDRMLADPTYQREVSQAVQHLSATSTVRQYDVTSGGTFTGDVVYKNPKTDEIVRVSLRPDIGEEAANVKAIQQLITDVKDWATTTDNTVLKNSWDREIQWLERFGFGIAPALSTGWHLFGYRLPSTFQIQPLGRDLWQGRMEVRGPAYQRIGHRLIVPAHQAAVLYGQVDRELREITEEFDASIKRLLVKAAESHGWKATREVVLQQWVPEILEPLVSQAQNPTATPYKVGDWVNGHQLTKEDFDAAKELKRRDNKMFSTLQRIEAGSPMPLLWFDPLQTAETVFGQPLSRRSTDYGLKMPRRPLSRQNERGRIFTNDWIKADNGVVRRQMLADNFDWVLMGSGLVGNTDAEFESGATDADKAFFRQIGELDRQGKGPTNLDELIDLAGQHFQTPDVDYATAAAEFELRLLQTVDRFVRQFNRALEIVPMNTRKLFERLAVPRGTIDAVGVGESPFLTPRGRLLAPPSFYRYTAADDQSWGAIQAGVRSVMTLREIEAVSAAVAAVDREVERFENPLTGEIKKMQDQLKATNQKRIGPFSARRRIARSSRKRADAGQLMYDYLTLKDVQRALTVLRQDLERLGREHVTMPEDNQAIQLVRNSRQTLTSSLLQSIISVFNNMFGGTSSNMLFRRGLGRWAFVTTPLSMLSEGAKTIAGQAVHQLRRVKGINKAFDAMLKTPGLRLLVQHLVEAQLMYERNRILAESSRVLDNPQPWQKAEVAWMFPETAGRLTDQEVGPVASLLNTLQSLPGVSHLLESGKAVFPGAFDRAINQVTSNLVGNWISHIDTAGLRAWQARDTGNAGWDDLASPMNRFTAQDLGLPSETAVAFWRSLLAPVGGLEYLTLQHYKRAKAGNQGTLLSDNELAQVIQEWAKKTNLADASATPTMFQGRGWSGEIRKLVFMLARYATNFAAVQENLAGRVYGDTSTPAKRWRLMSGAVAALLLFLIASAGKELGQETRQLVTGDPRTAQPFSTMLDGPTLADATMYVGTSISSVLPFIGERLTQAFGGTSNRPLLDATKIVAPLSVISDVENAILKTVQTGDAGYPLIDLLKRYVPLSGVVANRLMPGEVEAREASRGLRLAATPEMEIRQPGGQANAQTPLTPLMRKAVDAAYRGDQQAARDALDQAVAYRVSQGQAPAEAEAAVNAAFQARDPERTVFGRNVTADERRRILARMTDRQREAYLRSREVFARPASKRGRAFGRRSRRRVLGTRRRSRKLARSMT